MVPKNLSDLVDSASSIELHKQQILFAEGLNSKIRTTVVDVVKLIEKLNVHNEEGKQALSFQCNTFVENLGSIIYHLQNFLIHLDEKLISKDKVMKLIGKFVETVYSVQHSFSLDSEVLKLKFIKSIQDVNIEAAALLEIIETEKFHENKKMLITELSNLLRTLDCVGYYNKFTNLTFGLMKQFFDDYNNRLQTALDNIKDSNNKIALYYLIHSLDIACQHTQKVVHYLKTYAYQHDAKIHQVLIDGSTELHKVVVDTQDLIYKSGQINSIKNLLRKNATIGCEIMGEMGNFSQNKEVNVSLMEVIYVACSNCLALGDQLQRGLENVTLLIKLEQ